MTKKYKSKGKSICKDCAYRFRRCFIPTSLEDYVDEDGNALFSDNDNIVVLNLCLISNMDIDREITIDCNHYKNKDEVDNEDIIKSIPFFRHLRK